jgi:hypothetical protein
MMYRFKSQADGDLIMMQPVGDAVLRLIGKEPSAQGIIEAADLGAAIRALEAAVGAEDAARKAAGSTPPAKDARSDEKVSLRQRVWPMLEMMRRSQAQGADIVWGV